MKIATDVGMVLTNKHHSCKLVTFQQISRMLILIYRLNLYKHIYNFDSYHLDFNSSKHVLKSEMVCEL